MAFIPAPGSGATNSILLRRALFMKPTDAALRHTWRPLFKGSTRLGVNSGNKTAIPQWEWLHHKDPMIMQPDDAGSFGSEYVIGNPKLF
jgi:hypothetical protein